MTLKLWQDATGRWNLNGMSDAELKALQAAISLAADDCPPEYMVGMYAVNAVVNAEEAQLNTELCGNYPEMGGCRKPKNHEGNCGPE